VLFSSPNDRGAVGLFFPLPFWTPSRVALTCETTCPVPFFWQAGPSRSTPKKHALFWRFVENAFFSDVSKNHSLSFGGGLSPMTVSSTTRVPFSPGTGPGLNFALDSRSPSIGEAAEVRSSPVFRAERMGSPLLVTITHRVLRRRSLGGQGSFTLPFFSSSSSVVVFFSSIQRGPPSFRELLPISAGFPRQVWLIRIFFSSFGDLVSQDAFCAGNFPSLLGPQRPFSFSFRQGKRQGGSPVRPLDGCCISGSCFSFLCHGLRQ